MSCRFIDVLFSDPKERRLIIWHLGKWWQLPTMTLSHTTWEYRTPFMGSLDHVYLLSDQTPSSDQGFLATHDLPKSLSGVTASKFLTWWRNNNYAWLSEHSPANPAIGHNTKSSTEGSTKILNQDTLSQQAGQTELNEANHKRTEPKPADPNKIDTQIKASTQPTKPSALKSEDPKDIFDHLIDELNHDLLSPH